MKKILCAAAALIAVSSLHSQAIFHLGIMTSTRAKLMVDAGAGYAIKNFGIEGAIIAPPLDNAEDHPAYFAATTGYTVNINEAWSITGIAGTAYRMQSLDKKELNGFVGHAGIRIKFKDVYIGAEYMDKTVMLSVGMAGIFD